MVWTESTQVEGATDAGKEDVDVGSGVSSSMGVGGGVTGLLVGGIVGDGLFGG